jgi:ACS family glucarate transporter-like MFS transporter
LFDLYLARVALGAAQAGIFPCCTLILAVWYPRSLRGVATALLNSFMVAGSILAAGLTALLLEVVNWRLLFGLYTLPGLAWALWFAWWFRNRPADHSGVNTAELDVLPEPPPKETPAAKKGPPAAATPWLAILLNASLWLICVQQACRAGANRFYEYELPNYLQARGEERSLAGLLTGVTQVGGLVGGLVGGALSDWLLRRTGSRTLARKVVSIVSLASGAVCLFAASPAPNTFLSVLMFSLGAFLTTFAAPCSFALTIDVAGRHVAIVFALMNMAGNLGAYLFTQGLPLLRERTDWDTALAVFAGLHVVAAVCWLFIQPEQTIGENAGAGSVSDGPPPAQGPEPVKQAP